MLIETDRQDGSSLRRRAERRAPGDQDPVPLSPDEVRRLLHELQVHQIELEMQNDELRRTQAELERSRQCYFDLFNQAPIGYITLTEQGYIHEANLKAAALLGVEPGELAGRPIGHFLLPSDYDDFYFHHRQLLRTGEPQSCEARLAPRFPGAAITWLSLELAMTLALPEEHEWPANTCRVVLSDITERKRAENGLRLDAEKYRGLVQSLDSAVVVMDGQGRFLYMNDVAAIQLGGAPEKLTGKTLFELFPPETAARQLADIRKVLADGRGIVTEFQLFFQGKPRWHRMSVQPIHDEAGAVIYALVNSTDIHDTKVAQQELEELNRTLEERVRLRTAQAQDLYDRAPCGYHSLDVDGNMIMVNQTELDWLGYDREELIGKPIAHLLSPENARAFPEHYERFKVAGSVAGLEQEFIRKDGTVMPLAMTAVAVYDKDGQFQASRATLFDISARRQAEEVVRLANVEMQRALRLKDDFLTNMSHELRSPLSAILSLSEALTEEIGGPLNEKQKRYVDIITESGNHLLELINSILDLARINAGKMELELTRVEVAALAEASLRMVRQLAAKKDQQLIFKMDANVRHAIGDVRRLRQMLINLLGNAVKFTPDGGQIGLEVRGDAEHRILNFTVWDTGIGVRPENVPHLFEPFAQFDTGLARSAEGSGLGLPLVGQMAALHGGSVAMESEPGKGSRFTVSIPWLGAEGESPDAVGRRAGVADSAPRPPAGQGSAPADRKRRPKVLLVDDSEVTRLLLIDYLGSRGYVVFSAKDGFEGVAQAMRNRPDVILMDVMMPGLDGIATTRRIRAMPDLRQTPIIALTALVMPGDCDRCLEAGMNDYLSKPVNLEHLVGVIEHHLA